MLTKILRYKNSKHLNIDEITKFSKQKAYECYNKQYKKQ